MQASVQAQLRVRVAGRRSVSLNSGPGAELAGRPEPSPRPAEDASASGPGTEDSEGDSARTEGGSKKRKAPGKKGAAALLLVVVAPSLAPVRHHQEPTAYVEHAAPVRSAIS